MSDSSILQLGDHPQPERRSFALGDSQAEIIYLTFANQPDCQVDGLVDDVRAIAIFHQQVIEVDNHMEGFKWAHLPGRHVLNNRIGN